MLLCAQSKSVIWQSENKTEKDNAIRHFGENILQEWTM